MRCTRCSTPCNPYTATYNDSIRPYFWLCPECGQRMQKSIIMRYVYNISWYPFKDETSFNGVLRRILREDFNLSK